MADLTDPVRRRKLFDDAVKFGYVANTEADRGTFYNLVARVLRLGKGSNPPGLLKKMLQGQADKPPWREQLANKDDDQARAWLHEERRKLEPATAHLPGFGSMPVTTSTPDFETHRENEIKKLQAANQAKEQT